MAYDELRAEYLEHLYRDGKLDKALLRNHVMSLSHDELDELDNLLNDLNKAKSMAAVSKEVPRHVARKTKRKAARLRNNRLAKGSRRKEQESAAADDGYELPVDFNKPPENLHESILFFYGRKSIGKTTLANMFEKALTFMFERGRRNLKIRMLPKPGMPELTWADFLGYVEKAIADPSVQTIVIDTIDRAYDACVNYVCERAGCSHPNDKKDYGKTWKAVKDEFDGIIFMIKQSGKGVILLSHEKPKTLVRMTKELQRENAEEEGEESENEFSRMEPSCSNQAFEVVQEMCDFVFYLSWINGKRAATVRSPNETAWTACGIDDVFMDPKGRPINSFELGNKPHLAYEAMLKAHKNKLYDINHSTFMDDDDEPAERRTAKKKVAKKSVKHSTVKKKAVKKAVRR